jgi:hypothetical protein
MGPGELQIRIVSLVGNYTSVFFLPMESVLVVDGDGALRSSLQCHTHYRSTLQSAEIDENIRFYGKQIRWMNNADDLSDLLPLRILRMGKGFRELRWMHGRV